MQSISNTLLTAIQADAHVVAPSVQVDWVSGKSLTNAKGYSSVDDYSNYVRSLNPALYYRLNDNIDYLTAVNTGPKPVSHWRMNNDSGSLPLYTGQYIVQNESGYNNLALYGTSGSHLLLGQAGNVQDYRGTVSQSTKFISYGGTPGYGLTLGNDVDNRWSIADHNNFSVEMWFKPTATAVESVLLYKSNTKYFLNQADKSGLSPEWTLSLESLYPRFIIFNDKNNGYKPLASKYNIYTDIKSSTAVVANTWNHVVVTFDGRVLNMFLNNILVKSNSVVNGSLSNQASGPICVAARYFDYLVPPAPEASTNFQGWIDEIVIYNETLSAYDVRSRWASGSLNISGRAADTGATIAGTSIYRNIIDYSGKGRDGFIVTPSGIDSNVMSNGNVISPFVGRLDKGNLFFVDKTCKVDAGYLTSDNTLSGTSVFTGNAITVSAWVYVTARNPAISPESIEMIAAQGNGTDGSAANNAWYLTMRKKIGNGLIEITASINDGVNNPIASISDISTNAWHHIVMTVDSSNRLNLMLDGDYATAEATRTVAVGTMNMLPSWKTFIGGRQDSERCRDTYISEVAIINAKTDLRAWSTLYRSVVNINDFKSVNKFYDPLQLINGQKESTVTWAVLDAVDENGNVLTANGDYYLSEHSASLEYTDYEYGWWSKNKSDGSGNFAASAYPSVYLTFDGINCNAIDIYSTNKYGPINNFNLYYEYSTDNGVTYQWSSVITKASANITSLGNGSYIYSLASTMKIRAMQIFITSTLYPNDVARIEELSPRWTEDISSSIVSMNINKKRENYDSSVPLGATAANTAEIVLDNTNLRFNPQNTSSDLYGLLSPNIKFVTGYNYTTTSGSSPEYIQQGIFYSDTWGIDSSSMTVSTSLRDFSGKLQDSMVTDGYIASNITASQAIADLAVRSGVPRSKLNIDYNYATQVALDKPSAFWRFNETQLDQNALYFDSHLYLYSHPFNDLLMSATDVPGVKKDTTYAARKILPKTFYDFPHSELTLEFWLKCGSTAYSKTIYNYATKRFADEFKVSLDSTGRLVTRVQTYAPGGAEAAGVTSTTVVADNYWHHVSIVVDPAASSVAGNVQVTYYLDGIADGTGTLASFRPFVPSGQCLIGASFTPSTIDKSIFRVNNTSAATVGAVYTNNSNNFTVVSTIVAGTTMLVCTGVGVTAAGYGVLTKSSGTGDATINFTSVNNSTSNGPHTLNSSSIFNGYLKEFKIWSTASTKPQIVSRMNAPISNDKIGAYSSNVYKNLIMSGAPVAYWPLDMRLNSANTSTFIRDISGHDRNGTATTAGLTSVSGPIVSEDSSRSLKFPVSTNTPYINVSNAIGGSYIFAGLSGVVCTTGDSYGHNGNVYTVSASIFGAVTLTCYGSGTPSASGTLTKISGASTSTASIVFTSFTSSETIVQNLPFEGDIAGNIAPQVRHFSLFDNTLVSNSTMSMEFWIKPTSIPSKGSVLSKTSATTANREWVISLNTNGTIQLDVYSTTAVAISLVSDTDKALSLGSWHHVVCTFSGSKVSLYIDGKSAGYSFLPSLPSGTYVSNITSSLRMGLSAAGGDALYDSALAHVAIYRRSLSQQEIYNHYVKAGYETSAAAPDQVGKLFLCLPMNQNKFYSFDELRQSGYAYSYGGQRKENIVFNISKIGNHMYAYTDNTSANPVSSGSWQKSWCLSVKDYALNKNYLNYRIGASPYDELSTTNVITYNNASPISSEIEKSTYFNSTLDQVAYMNYTTDLPMTISSTSSFSIEMWVKPTVTVGGSDERFLLSRENFGSTVQAGTWRLSIGTDGKVKFAIYPTTAAGALSITPSPTPSALTANEWAHLAFVFYISGVNSVLEIYKNGVIYTTYTWATASAALTSAEVKTLIGGYQVSTANNFNGGISNVAVYNRRLSIGTIALHYARGISIYQNIYPGIAASSDSYWGEMLKIATADIGMFYFSEDGMFVYEHGRSYDDAMKTQHSVVQYTLDDNEDIISASQSVELQVNKVSVKVYPKLVSGGATASIWSAPSGTSLAISTLSNGISATSTDGISFNTTKNPAGLMEPIWLDSGIIKIDDEFIKYNKTSGNTLFDITRGYWNSIPSAHLTNAIVSEAREFNMEWSGSPVFYVKYPFITGVLYDKTISASHWRFSGEKGYIRLYASNNAMQSSRYLTIEGNNPITKLDNFFHVAGYVADSKVVGSQIVTEVAEDYKDNIRKYGEKVLQIDNPLIQSEAYAKDLAQFLLAKYSVPVPVLEISTMGTPHLQLGDRIEIDTLDSMSIVAGEYWIMSIDCSYSGSIEQKMSLRRVS